MEGYKIQKGDYIILQVKTDSQILEKPYTVAETNETQAIIKFNNRYSKKFPRYYKKPFEPCKKKTKPDYKSPNTWYVRVKDSLKHLRLRYKDID